MPEGRRDISADLSVYENLKMGAYTRKDKEEIAADAWKWSMRDFLVWKNRKDQIAGTLSRW